jgi:F-type H+-transporting ATPase subunit delta
MATVDERSLGVARLYARSMLDVALEQGTAADLGDELDAVVTGAERDEEFASFLMSPVLERDKRRRSLETMLRGRASDLLVDSLQVINRKGRMAILSQIVSEYHEAHRETLGQIEIRITSAVRLTDEQREDIRQRTKERTGKDTFLIEQVDPSLLGGLVVQVGDQKVDMSVRRDLQLLSSRFARRLSAEVVEGGRFVTEGETAGDEAGGSHDRRDEEE